jgi:mono/diheme cytochrome c family protein
MQRSGMKTTGPGGTQTMLLWIALAALLGCGPRMDDQPSVEAYEGVVPPMPDGTVARTGGDPMPGDDAPLLSNPFPPAPEHRKRGAALFSVYCMPCHGQGGRGDGPVAEPLGIEVRDLLSEHVTELTDGEIYRTITAGTGAMLGLRGLIAPDERWLIVLAVRALADSTAEAPADSTAEAPADSTAEAPAFP